MVKLCGLLWCTQQPQAMHAYRTRDSKSSRVSVGMTSKPLIGASTGAVLPPFSAVSMASLPGQHAMIDNQSKRVSVAKSIRPGCDGRTATTVFGGMMNITSSHTFILVLRSIRIPTSLVYTLSWLNRANKSTRTTYRRRARRSSNGSLGEKLLPELPFLRMPPLFGGRSGRYNKSRVSNRDDMLGAVHRDMMRKNLDALSVLKGGSASCDRLCPLHRTFPARQFCNTMIADKYSAA